MLSGWAIKQLKKITLDYLDITCAGNQCYGVLAVRKLLKLHNTYAKKVHRINFALGMLHILLAAALFGVQSTRDKRSSLQNGFWGPKLIAWAALIVASFFIPNEFFMIWGNYIALIGSVLFILYSLILLIDFAHTWAETCLEKYEETESSSWQVILIGSTFVMYCGALTMTVLMYVFFSSSGCDLNQAFVSVNLVLCFIDTCVAIHPIIQEHNSRSGLVQSAMVCLYATYLTFSAVCNGKAVVFHFLLTCSEPDDKHCNPLARSKGSRTASVVLGALFTFLAIAYSTTRAATTSGGIGKNNGYVALGDTQGEGSVVTDAPSERAQMRRDAVRQAVESGGLPASALDDDIEDDESQIGAADKDDEKNSVQYHYTTFHFVFFLATCYTACLLTGW
jgi:hypothetical protein